MKKEKIGTDAAILEIEEIEPIAPIEPIEHPKSLAEIMKPISGFEVASKGKKLSYLTVDGRLFILNHHSEPLIGAKGALISPPTQEQLKTIFDSNPVNAQFVKEPEGYKAEWSKFQ